MVKNPLASAGDMGSIPAQEGPMCCGETKPASHNYCAHCAPITGAHTPWGLRCWTKWLRVKNLPANAGDAVSIPGPGRSPGGGNGNPLQYFLPGKFHGQRNLAGYSPWGRKEPDMTKYSTEAAANTSI